MLCIRPYPEPKEGLSEYLLRIAFVNGYFKLGELLRVIEMEQTKTSRFSKWSHKQLLSVEKALKVYLGRDVDNVIELHDRCENQNWLHMTGRALHELITDFPRICTSCLKEEKVMDWRWSIATVARCVKHKIPLLDTCPNCDKPLKWDANIFEFCPTCKTRWDVSHNAKWSSVELSPLERFLWPTIDGSLNLSPELIEDVCLAIYAMARPYDALISPFHRVPYSKNHGLLVLKGLQTLENEQHRKDWLKEAQKKWQAYWEIVNPIMLFNGLVSKMTDDAPNWALNDFEERSRYIKLARSNSTEPDENPNFHVNHNVLAEALNLNIEDLIILFDKRVFVHINKSFTSPVKMLDKKIFDLQKIRSSIKLHTNKNTPAGYIGVTPKYSLLSRNLAKYGELLCAVFNNEIDGYFVSWHDLNSVSIDLRQLNDWLKTHLGKVCRNPIPINDVALALGTSITTTKRLVRMKKLAWAEHQRKGDFIDGPSFKRYLIEIKDDIHWLTIMD